MPLERHEERVVGQPVRVLLLEGGHLLPLAQKSPLVGLTEQSEPPVEERLVIHPPGVAPKVAGRALLSCEQPVAHQQLEVDEIRVPRKGGEGLIGRVAVARRPQGQDLPIFLPGRRKKIHKPVRFLPQRADPIRRGERKDGEQNPARSHKNHPFCRFAPANILRKTPVSPCEAKVGKTPCERFHPIIAFPLPLDKISGRFRELMQNILQIMVN